MAPDNTIRNTHTTLPWRESARKASSSKAPSRVEGPTESRMLPNYLLILLLGDQAMMVKFVVSPHGEQQRTPDERMESPYCKYTSHQQATSTLMVRLTAVTLSFPQEPP